MRFTSSVQKPKEGAMLEVAAVFGGAYAGQFANRGVTASDATFAFDVPGELQGSGLELSEQGVFVVTTKKGDTLGKLVRAFAQKNHPHYAVLARSCRRVASEQHGYAQVRAFADENLRRSVESVDETIQALINYLASIANGPISAVTFKVYCGMAGGCGSGSFPFLFNRLRYWMRQMSPDTSVSWRLHLADYGSWLGLTNQIKINGACSSAALVHQIAHDFVLGDEDSETGAYATENFIVYVESLPNVGADKALRNDLASMLTAMMESFDPRLEMGQANETMVESYGGSYVVRPSFHGALAREDVVATVAQHARQELRRVRAIKIANDTGELVFTTSYPKLSEVSTLIKRAKETQESTLLDELTGLSSDSPTCIVTSRIDGRTLPLKDFVPEELTDYESLISRITMADLLGQLHASTRRQLEQELPRAKKKADAANEEVTRRWRDCFTPGFRIRLIGRETGNTLSMRLRALEQAVVSCRKATAEYREILAKLKALDAVYQFLRTVETETNEAFETAIQRLDLTAEKGRLLDGISFRSSPELIVNILRVTQINAPDKKLDQALLSGVSSVSCELLTNELFGQQVGPRKFPALLRASTPEFLAPWPGERDRILSECKTTVLVPFAQEEANKVSEAFRALDPSVVVVRLNTFAAGVFLGTLFVLPVTSVDDILTPNNLATILEMAKKRPDRLAKATLPGQALWIQPDKRQLLPDWIETSDTPLPEDLIQELIEAEKE